jgi:hypothetical protein
MRREHISADGFWQMPGKPVGDWPGTKNGRDHRVALSEPARGGDREPPRPRRRQQEVENAAADARRRDWDRARRTGGSWLPWRGISSASSRGAGPATLSASDSQCTAAAPAPPW